MPYVASAGHLPSCIPERRLLLVIGVNFGTDEVAPWDVHRHIRIAESCEAQLMLALLGSVSCAASSLQILRVEAIP
jgi:hypothetical protein